MENVNAEQPLFPRQLAERCGGAVKEGTWRMWQRRAKNRMPSIVRGSSDRPHRLTYPSVAEAMLRYEMGVADYAEVVEAARRVPAGALQ